MKWNKIHIKIINKMFGNSLLRFPMMRSQQGKPIAIFAARRGGSSILAETIGVNKAMMIVDQPFDRFHDYTRDGRKRIELLPDKYRSQFIDLTEEEEKYIEEYVCRINKGKLQLSAVVPNPLFFLLIPMSNRVVLKIVNANSMVNWFHRFDIHVIYMSRHPIAQSLSIMRNNWGLTVDAYLKSKYFCCKYLKPEMRIEAEKIMNSGDHFLQCILNWIFENLVPMKYSNEQVFKFTYEELCLFPEHIISLLAKILELSKPDRMVERFRAPSRTMGFSTKEAKDIIRNIKDDYSRGIKLISRWMHEVEQEKAKKAIDLCKFFGLNWYEYDSPFPAKERYVTKEARFLNPPSLALTNPQKNKPIA